MVSVADIYFDQFKRNLEMRRQIIFVALGLAFTFGVWVLQRKLNGVKPDLIDLKNFELGNFLALAIAFVVCWSAYFLILLQIERATYRSIKNLKRELPLNDQQQLIVEESLNTSSKYIPFAISSITVLAIVFMP
jgi:large-conductance mechanosensitive channel